MTVAVIGYGCTLKVAAVATPTVADQLLAEVFNITPPAFKRDTVDATNFDSTNMYKEMIPGLKDAGEVQFELNWLPQNATDNILLVMRNEMVGRLFRLDFTQLTTARNCQFKAFLIEYSGAIPIEDRLTASITLRIDRDNIPLWA